MRALDLLSFILTVLGTYAVFLSLRLLLPYYVMQYVEARLKQTEERLNEAEAENAIPSESEYRERFVSHDNQFSQMRMASNQSPQFMQQLRLAALSCLTYKLYALYSRIGTLQREVEIAMDQHQLASIAFIRSTISTTLPASATSTRHLGAHLSSSLTSRSTLSPAARETPAINVTELASPPLAARGLTYPQTLMMSMDQHQLAPVVSNQSATASAITAAPATITTTPIINATEPTVPPPAARCLTYPPDLKGAPQMTTDEHQLASVACASNQSNSATAQPAPTAVTATPAINVAELTGPLPALS